MNDPLNIRNSFPRLGRKGVLKILVLSILVVGLFFGVSASAFAVPAITFGYIVDSTGQIPNPDIHTWYCATRAASYLGQIGYSTTSYENQSAYALYNNFGNNAIWYWAFHGGEHGGWILTKKPSPPATSGWAQYLVAQPNTPNSSPAGGTVAEQRYYENNMTASYVTHTLLAVFHGCQTAMYPVGHAGDANWNICRILTDQKGVDTAVGFNTNVSAATWDGMTNPGEWWANEFFASLAAQYSVSTALDSAASAFYQHFGDAGGYGSGVVFGNASLNLYPVRWSAG